ncbi:MAG: hypothetical protein A2516_09695 [Alphaproteobacteria bacterium RIFOXYD12_FULL_60_8]|nr:MAG: hypothetical protein A2516_09695 [Alphaproteobacteria bacterium RIFOXYD12_FULL_60_8]
MDVRIEPRDIIDQAIISFYAAPDTQTLQAALEHVLNIVGFRYFAYTFIQSPDEEGKPLTLSNFPKEWCLRYLEETYFCCDPVLQVSLKSFLPVEWADALADVELTDRQKTMMAEAASYGLKNGLTIPVHQAGSSSAYFNLASDLGEAEYELHLERYRHVLHVLAFYFHDVALRHLGRSSQFISLVKLTKREMECLQWCGKGKTSLEIGKILELAERTVNFHLTNAMRKLRVHTRAQAVAKLYPLEGVAV